MVNPFLIGTAWGTGLDIASATRVDTVISVEKEGMLMNFCKEWN